MEEQVKYRTIEEQKSQEPSKDYHETVAQKYGGENLTSIRKAIDQKEYYKVLDSMKNLEADWKVKVVDRVYDGEKEVIAQTHLKDKTITL